MKKLIGIAVVVAIVLVVVFGWDNFKSYASATKQRASDIVAENVSPEFEQARIKSLLSSKREEVENFKAQVTGLDGKIEIENQVIARAEEVLAQRKVDLAKAGALLKENKETYIIVGKEFSKAEVNLDAQARLGCIENLQAKIAFHQTLVATLLDTSKKSKVGLQEAVAKIQDFDQKLEELKAREVNAQIQASIASMSDEMTSFSMDITGDSQLQKSMSNYERKIIAKESRGSLISDVAVINYNAPKPVDATSTIDQIDAVLQ